MWLIRSSLPLARRPSMPALIFSSSAGRLRLTPHPASLGSALTHARVTTDYSESLLELITDARITSTSVVFPTPPLLLKKTNFFVLVNFMQNVYIVK